MLNNVMEIWQMFEQLLGVSPALMIPVFLLVSLLAHATKIRERFPEWKNFILGVMCLFVGGVVSLLQEAEGARVFIENALILGSVSALSYQIMKGLLEGVRAWIEKTWKDRTGVDIDTTGGGHFL